MLKGLLVSRRFLIIALATASLSSNVQSAPGTPATSSRSPLSPPNLLANFVANQGQWNGPVRFAARRDGLALLLERHAMRLQLGADRADTLAFVFEGASSQVELAGEEQRPGVYNFISGRDARAWRLNVPAYRSVLYRGMYGGIDVRVREQSQHFEYDLIIAPHTDLRQVVVRVDGATSIELAGDGGLIVGTNAGPLRQTPPATLETLPDGTMRPVASVFRVIDKNRYGFDVPGRDASLPLVIDPGLIWSTLIGGTSNETMASFEAARDGSGDLFIAGSTYSTDFGNAPTPVQTGRYKAFVARLDTSGARYDFVTFINGLQNQTYPGGMAPDAGGGVTVVGSTVDLDFPVTDGAYQTVLASPITGLSNGDAFVLRLGATGAPVFSTYLGGSGLDGATSVVMAPSGDFIVSGTTRSTDFPITVGAFDTTFNAAPPDDRTALSEDIFIARLTGDGSRLTYGTYFGGRTYEVVSDSVIDAQGYLTVAGYTTSSANGVDMPVTADAFDKTWNGSEDGFIARFRLDGNGTADLKYASFLGGVNWDNIHAIALDPTNPEVVAVVGFAWYDMFTGPFFPSTPGVYKPKLTPIGVSPLFPHTKTGFVTKFRFPAGGPGTLVWSTFAGGNWEDFLSDVGFDELGNVIVAGASRSYDLPTTRGAIDRTQDGVGNGPDDCFVWKLNPTGAQLLYSTYFGGTGSDCQPLLTLGARLAYLGNNTIALAGTAVPFDFPTTPGTVRQSADPVTDPANPFVAKMTLAADASGDLTVDAPALRFPANNSTFATNGLVRLQWNEVVDPSGIEGYVYEVTTRSDFASEWTAYKGSVNGTELIIESMAINTPWFWRVRAADGAGNIGDWSAVSTFTLGVDGGSPIVNYIQVYPTAVTGGSSAQGILTLNNPAPAGGLPVTLMTKGPIGIPAAVTVPAGALNANFTITTTPVTRSIDVPMYATSNGVGAKGTITVDAGLPPQAVSMIFDPLAVTGGNPATGIVTLAGPAPPGGTVVPLLSSHPHYASVPASVTVPAGAKSATFPIATSPVPFSFDVTIEAVSTQNASRKLALKTPGPRLTSFTLSANNVTGGATLTGTIRFSAPIPPSPFPATGDALVNIKSTNPAIGVSPITAVPVGQTSATFSIGVRNVPATTTFEIIATYDDVVLRAPITVNGSSAALSSLTLNVNSVSGGQGGVGHVTLTAPAPAGHVLINLSASHPALNVPADVTVSSGSTTGLFAWTANSVTQTTPATITASYGPSNVSANVTVNPATTKNLWVTSLAVNPTSVTGGSSSTATVTLNDTAPSGGATVQLSSMSPAAVPASVTVPAGATSATFSVTTTSVTSTTQARVWALLNTSWGAVLTVQAGGSPPPPPPPSGGTPAAPTLLAPSSGATVPQPLTFDWNDVTNAASYQIQVDTSSSFGSPFTINTTTTVSQLTTSALTARQYWWRVRGRNSAGTNGSWSSTRSFTVQTSSTPPAPTLSSLSISPTSVTGGSANATGTATLTAAAPAGGAVVTLSSSNTNAATVPASVTIAAGSTNATFTITSRTVTTATSVTVSGVYGGVTRTGTLTVNAQGAPSTPTLSSLSISPTSVTGGSANAQGTATLSAAAPSGGTVVTVSSNNTTAATVPASITIAAGATSGTFTVTSRTVATSASVTISGSAGGVTRTGTLTVNPAAGGGGTATLTVSATGRSGERVTSSPAGINVSVGSSGSAPFNAGASITLTVSNGRDAIWSGACSSGGNKTKTCTFTLNANASVTANVQ
jgi:hypothetical protein